MRLSAPQRAALRKRIARHILWPDLRKRLGWKLDTMSAAQLIEAAHILLIDPAEGAPICPTCGQITKGLSK